MSTTPLPPNQPAPAPASTTGLGKVAAILVGPSLVLFGIGYLLFGRSADNCSHQPPTARWPSPDGTTIAIAYVDECGGALGGQFSRIRLMPTEKGRQFNTGLAFSGSDSTPGVARVMSARWVSSDTLVVTHAGFPRMTIAKRVGAVRIVDAAE